MNKLAILFVVGTAALFGGASANAADTTVKAKASNATQSTDISSRGRHYRVQRYGYRNYRPHYGNSYGYYQPRAYYGGGYGGQPYYGSGYGYGGPSISFGFGSGRGYW